MMMRHVYGFLSAFLILTIYGALVIFFVEPIVIEQLVMKAKESRELFKAVYMLLLLANGAAIYYIVFRQTAIAGRKIYIPIFWTAFIYILCFSVHGLLGSKAFAYGILPLAKTMAAIDLTTFDGWQKAFFLFLVIPGIPFAAYIKNKKRPSRNPNVPLTFAQLGSFVFGIGLAAYQYQSSASTSDNGSVGTSDSTDSDPSSDDDYDIPDFFN